MTSWSREADPIGTSPLDWTSSSICTTVIKRSRVYSVVFGGKRGREAFLRGSKSAFSASARS